jgi:PIF1-like helicase
MCLDQTLESAVFAAWLLDIGSGKNLPQNMMVTLPTAMKVPGNNVEGLVNAIYLQISHGVKPDKYFLDRTILCCKNDVVDILNKEILDMFPGEETVVHSIDKITEGEEHYPPKFLNSINITSLLLAHLVLKPSCPLMLLYNIDTANGLCNRTRLILLAIKTHVLECQVLGEKFAGNMVFIPRISLEPSNKDLPVPLSC